LTKANRALVFLIFEATTPGLCRVQGQKTENQ